MSVERVERFGARVLDEFFRVSKIAHVRRRSRSLNQRQTRNVWPYLGLEMPVEIARAALVYVQAGNVIAQIADDSEISTQLGQRLVELLVVGKVFGARQMVGRQRHGGA